MPELAEVRLTADFINRTSAGKRFFGVWKNPVHKLGGIDLSPYISDGEFFTLEAKSRGKELKIVATPESSEQFSFMFTLGMGGHFSFNEIANRAKHTHFSILSHDGNSELEFVDVRRFGRWKIGDWNPDRSPDLTTEYESWKENIKNNINHKDFKKPFYEWLMNQRWINGYGNYLRAELVQRMDVDPFLSASEIITKNSEDFFHIAPKLPSEAYLLGGGQLYSWVNPFNDGKIVPGEWDRWMKAYKNPNYYNLIDTGGRRFWYSPKWHKND